MTDWLGTALSALAGIVGGGFGMTLWSWLFRRRTDKSAQAANYAKVADAAWSHLERVQADHARQLEVMQIEMAQLKKEVMDRDSLIARQTLTLSDQALTLSEQAAEISRLRTEVSSLRWQLDHQRGDGD
jgi:tRNA threonylcarbamoyladenosine modification (KEOPS) complex  Pcc1 subunit